jgi:hypothetical protein
VSGRALRARLRHSIEKHVPVVNYKNKTFDLLDDL